MRSYTKIYNPISHLLEIIRVPFFQSCKQRDLLFYPTNLSSKSSVLTVTLVPRLTAQMTLTLTGTVSDPDNDALLYIF